MLREQPRVSLRPKVARRVKPLVAPRARRPGSLTSRGRPSGSHRRPAPSRKRRHRQRVVRERRQRPRLAQRQRDLLRISLAHPSVPRRAVSRPDRVETRRERTRRVGEPRRLRSDTEARSEWACQAVSLGRAEGGPWRREHLPQLHHLSPMHGPHLLESAWLSLEALGRPGQRRHGRPLAHLVEAAHAQRLVDLVALRGVEDRVGTRQIREAVEEAVAAVCRHRRHRVLGSSIELAELTPHSAGSSLEPGRDQTHSEPVGASGGGEREPLRGHVMGSEPHRLAREESRRPARRRGRSSLHRHRAREGTWRRAPPHPATRRQQQRGGRGGRDRKHVEDDLGVRGRQRREQDGHCGPARLDRRLHHARDPRGESHHASAAAALATPSTAPLRAALGAALAATLAALLGSLDLSIARLHRGLRLATTLGGPASRLPSPLGAAAATALPPTT